MLQKLSHCYELWTPPSASTFSSLSQRLEPSAHNELTSNILSAILEFLTVPFFSRVLLAVFGRLGPALFLSFSERLFMLRRDQSMDLPLDPGWGLPHGTDRDARQKF